jgi:flagellar assembly protein FliH
MELPMKIPPSRGIIHNAKVEGSVFYSTTPNPETEEKEISPKKIDSLREAEMNGYRRGLKEGHQQGYEAGNSEGYDIGYRQGMAAVQEELKNAVELLKKTSASYQIYQEEMFEQTKPELIRFALAVCEKILRAELSNPKAFITLLEKLYLQAKTILKDAPIAIVLAPADLKMLENNISAAGFTTDELRNANFIADPHIERGNCRLETSFGLLNFDINRLLNNLELKTLEA